MTPAGVRAHATAVRAELVPAPSLLLHGGYFGRGDCNCPTHRHAGRTYVFVSHYLPIGHSYRRIAADGLESLGPPERVRLIDDPDPAVGKWIESTWRAPDGRLYGWYHAEEVVPCAQRLFLPHIGAVVSDDDGATWRCLGELLKVPENQFDCAYRNGFVAGGYGDFTAVPDRTQSFFYLHFSSYVLDERRQGIAIARYPVADRDQPAARLELWCNGGWRPTGGALPSPLWPPRRGWRHADPAAFWGPAVHFNRDLGLYVMLLNRTEHGTGDIRQEGVYLSANDTLEDPGRWSAPVRIVEGGGWYPQIIGLGPADSDSVAGAEARFFMTGFSQWHIRFARDLGAG